MKQYFSLFVLAILFVLHNTSRSVVAQTCIGVTEFENNDAGIIYYQKLIDTEIGIYAFDLSDAEIVNTDISIPRNANNVILDPMGNLLAYNFVGVVETTDVFHLTIELVILETGEVESALMTDTNTYQSISQLRWIDDDRLGFISNSQTEEYVIVELENDLSTQNQINLESHISDYEYSWNFSYLAFFEDGDLTIQSSETTDTYELEVYYDFPGNRNFVWSPSGTNFHFMSSDRKWFVVTPEDDSVTQLTDTSVYLRYPSIAPNNETIAYRQSKNVIWNPEDVSLTVFVDDPMSLCVTGQVVTSHAGWDISSNYFAFSVIENGYTNFYLLDVTEQSLHQFDSVMDTTTASKIIGWDNTIIDD